MTYYYGVVYFDNGEASISRPYESLDALMIDMKEGVLKHAHRVVATSYMTRSEKLPTQKLFGCPNSRNLMKDKKFLEEIQAN